MQPRIGQSRAAAGRHGARATLAAVEAQPAPRAIASFAIESTWKQRGPTSHVPPNGLLDPQSELEYAPANAGLAPSLWLARPKRPSLSGGWGPGPMNPTGDVRGSSGHRAGAAITAAHGRTFDKRRSALIAPARSSSQRRRPARGVALATCGRGLINDAVTIYLRGEEQ